MRKYLLLILAILLIPAGAREMKDAFGYNVTLPDTVTRTVSMDSMVSQFIFALQKTELLVAARASSSVRGSNIKRSFPHMRELIDAGNSHNADIELIFSLKPDIIFTTAGKAADRLSSLGAPLFFLEIEGLDKIRNTLFLMGSALNAEKRAAEIVSYLGGLLERAAKNRSSIPEEKKRKVYMTGSGFLSTFGADFFQNELVLAAGGISVTSGLKGGKVNISLEEVYRKDPDFIFNAAYCKEDLKKIKRSKTYRGLRAVKEGNIKRMPFYLISWDTPGPEAVLGILWMQSVLYPEFFKEDIKKLTREFYERVYGIALSEKEIEEIFR